MRGEMRTREAPAADGSENQAAQGKRWNLAVEGIPRMATVLGTTEPDMGKRRGAERAIIRYPVPIHGT